MRFRSERRGPADQAAKIEPEAFADFAKDQFLRGEEPQAARGFSIILLLPGTAAVSVDGPDERPALCEVFFDSTLHAFEQGRHIEKIVGSGEADFVGEVVEVG